MKIVAQNYKTGELGLVDGPAPMGKPGGLLVRTEYSLISVGTEMMKVGEAKLSMLGKVRARPDQVRKVLESVAAQGPQATFKKVMNKLDSYTPLGYSLCGTVVEVGEGVTGFSVGQRVACAGNQYALHAELNWVPVNLCTTVPDGVDSRHAAFTTVGAIAMQGLRQGELGLGDVAVVVGLGLIGQLLTQLLVASGVRVVGVDLSPERCKIAEAAGAIYAGSPVEADLSQLVAAVAEVSDGHGADAVFLAAGGPTNQPVELAAELARDRGRVVDIGKCSLDLPWNAYYEKELDVRFSRSYGPGRYDPMYEERGIDYPIGYVRWTEGRNMACFLDLLGRGLIDLEPLVSATVPFADAVSTYEQLNAGELKGIGFVFEYPRDADMRHTLERPLPHATAPSRATPVGDRAVRIGFIGAGNYASTMLLPHLAKPEAGVALSTVATSSALSSLNAQRKFGFGRTTTDYTQVLDDPDIDAVFVVTRHHDHAAKVCEALRAGKAVFVEKPLVVNREQLDEVRATIAETGNDRLAVGFNRRFAPLLTSLRAANGDREQPAMVRYLVNAGSMEAGSWYADARTEGSRFVGEGGHFIDTCSWWLGATPVAVHASAAQSDDVQATITYDDGSVAAITYTTSGSKAFPKETFEAVGDGKVARLDNFTRASLWTPKRRRRLRRALAPDKGQAAEVAAFVQAVRRGGPMPIALTSLFATTAATLAVEESIAAGAAIDVRQAWAP